MAKLPKLIEPNSQKKIGGIQIPEELYWVLDYPSPLAGMSYPKRSTPWVALKDAGFTSLISLEPNSFDSAPLEIVFCEKLQDLYGGITPRNPNEEKQRIIRAVKNAMAVLLKGEGVLVHCYGGTGRTGTVIGCVLRELGYSDDETIKYLDRVQKARGRKKMA